MGEMYFDFYFRLYIVSNLKCIMVIQVKVKSIKGLEENILKNEIQGQVKNFQDVKSMNYKIKN